MPVTAGNDLKGKQLAEFASDIQAGVGAFEVGDFDDLRIIGMAASLAVQLRGLPELDYAVLSKVSDSLFNIPTVALKPVLRALSESGMVKLYETGKTINKIDPDVPYFEDVYQIIGDYSDQYTFNETEQAMVAIMARLKENPENVDRLVANMGIEKDLAQRCFTIGSDSGLITQHRARGQTILLSPVYFADNNSGLADLLSLLRCKTTGFSR